MKVYIDNNFFTKYETCKDESYKQALKRAFLSNKFSFYPSIYLLEEIMGIAKCGISDQLKDRIKLVLEILSGRVPNYHSRIIYNELGLESHSIFLPKLEVESLKQKMADIYREIAPNEQMNAYLEFVEQQKNEFLELYKKRQALIMNNKQSGKNIKVSFDEFKDRGNNKNILIEIIKQILGKTNINLDMPTINSKANSIADNIERYKYLNIYWDIIMALHYTYDMHYYDKVNNGVEHKVDRNDGYDAFHLFYLLDLDAIFTDDQRIAAICNLIFKGNKKVVSFGGIKIYL